MPAQWIEQSKFCLFFRRHRIACAFVITRLRLFSPFSSRSTRCSRFFRFCNIVCQERLAWNIKQTTLAQRNLIVFSSILACCCCCEEILKEMFYANLICAFRPAGPELGGLFVQMCFQVCSPVLARRDASTTHFRTTFHGERARWEKFFIDIL